MRLRAAGRLLWFGCQVVMSVVDYSCRVVWVPEKSRRAARAAWLQRATIRHLKIFGFTSEITGQIPRTGLLVSNHLSYLDILVLGSLTPAVFVSKADVRSWPVFGWLAALAGTVFIERERRLHVGAVNAQIQSALDDGMLVVVFPEGTSSNGREVLPFRSPLLEPVAGGTHHITVGRLHYFLQDGDAATEACYWGEHSFFPHLMNLLGKGALHAKVHFAPYGASTADRKELAKQLHAAVCGL